MRLLQAHPRHTVLVEEEKNLRVVWERADTGGALTFKSAMGVGTTFTVRLTVDGNKAERREAT